MSKLTQSELDIDLGKFIDHIEKRKWRALKYAAAIYLYSKSIKAENPELAERLKERSLVIRGCANVMEYDPEGKKVINLHRCGDRYCPICAHYRAVTLYKQNSEIMRRDPGKYVMITFTVPNCYGEALRENVVLMKKAYKKWAQTAVGSRTSSGYISGGIMSMEVTYNRDADKQGLPCFHPHFHMLAHVSDEYFEKVQADFAQRQKFRPYPRIKPGAAVQTSYTYINGSWEVVKRENKVYGEKYKWSEMQDALRLRWMQLIGIPIQDGLPLLQCEIHPVVPGEDGTYRGALLEVAKYMVKELEYSLDSKVIGTLLTQLRGMVQCRVIGSWFFIRREVVKEMKAEDERRKAEDKAKEEQSPILRKSRVFIVFDNLQGFRGRYHRVLYTYVPGWVDTMDDIRRDCGISHHRSKQEIERQRILDKVRHFLEIEKSDKFDLSVDFEQLKIEII